MAENEYLDSTNARRWHCVVQTIRDGGSIEEVADSVAACFFKTLRQIRKDLPLADLILAMDNPERNRHGGGSQWPRQISCSIELKDMAFWKQDGVNTLVGDALQFVSGDMWNLEFRQDADSAPSRGYLPFRAESFFDTPPVVCLYSGGLDSAAGLASRLRNGIDAPMIPIVVRHRTDIAKKATAQIDSLGRAFQTELRPICAAMSMVSPRRLGRCEETSQRARGFLFVSVGGAVAAATKGTVVELYESGVGAINAPLLAGMQGSQATRSAHPTFLRKMAQLLSVVADHPIDVKLPFDQMTKAKLNDCQWANLIDLPPKAA